MNVTRPQLILGTAVVIVLAVLGVVWLSGPERSVESYCKTWVSEGKKLHDQWNATRGNGSAAGSLEMLMGAPGDIAEFFEKLAEVAPDDIRPDVERYRDAWKEFDKRLTDAGGNPFMFLTGGMTLGAQTAAVERRINNWTSTNCQPYFNK